MRAIHWWAAGVSVCGAPEVRAGCGPTSGWRINGADGARGANQGGIEEGASPGLSGAGGLVMNNAAQENELAVPGRESCAPQWSVIVGTWRPNKNPAPTGEP